MFPLPSWLRHRLFLRILDNASPAPEEYFTATNPGGAECYQISSGNPPPPPNSPSAAAVMAADDPRLDQPVHSVHEIEGG